MSDDKDQPQVPFDAQPAPAQETQPTQPLQPIAQRPIQETQPLPVRPTPEEQPTQAFRPFAPAQETQPTQPITPLPRTTPIIPDTSVGQQPTSVFPTTDAAPDGSTPQSGYGQSQPSADASNGYGAYAVGAERAQSPYPAAGSPIAGNGSPADFAPTPNGPIPPQAGAPGAPQPNGPYPPQPGYPPYPNGQPFNPREGKWNVCAILGFILAFLFSLIGLILSIVGLNQIKKTHEKGRGLAIAGIVISIVFMVLGAVGGVAAYNATMQQIKASSSQSASGGAQSDQIGKDLDKGLDELEQDGSSDSGASGSGSDTSGGSSSDSSSTDDSGASTDLFGRYSSMSEMVADPTFQSQMQSSIGSSFTDIGATVTTRAEGDTLVIDIHLPSRYDAAKDQLASMLASSSDAAMQPMADELPSMVKTTGPAQARMYMHTDSQTIFDKTYTASNAQ